MPKEQPKKRKKTQKKKKKEAPIMKSSQNFTVTPVCQSLVSLVIMGSLLSICENLDLRKDLPDLPQGREAQCRSGPGGPKAGWILTVSFLPPWVFLPPLSSLPWSLPCHCHSDLFFQSMHLPFPLLPCPGSWWLSLCDIRGLSDLALSVCLASLFYFHFHLNFWHSQPRILFSRQSWFYTLIGTLQ